MTLSTRALITAGDYSRSGMIFEGLSDFDYAYFTGSAYGGADEALKNRAAASGDLTAEADTVVLQTHTRGQYQAGFVCPFTQAEIMSANALTMFALFRPDPTSSQQLAGNLAGGSYYVSLTADATGIAAGWNAPLSQAIVPWGSIPGGPTQQLFVAAQFGTAKLQLNVWAPGWSEAVTDSETVAGLTFPDTSPLRILSSEANTLAGTPAGEQFLFKKSLTSDADILAVFRRMQSLAYAFDTGVQAP